MPEFDLGDIGRAGGLPALCSSPLDCEQSLIFFKVAGVGRTSGEQRSREKRETRNEGVSPGRKCSLCQNAPCLRTRRILGKRE